ncbi:hypothetical protein GPECTOR_45g160 [Gonium pectorale]|uniref:DNA replication complex GINS protein SLD5 C-terminal domain-containing protein n=1 Tax=Gonium pectorale TaxID=33097 RepID=A0A150GAB5_GONPE|nr:hypothetical protein GPECTOR_45g160 [Gonium pectorale]|eukprot:KXZ46290.1 hypothetical protein GPECTOR_45g160 [Gonium pectorale]
MIPTPVLDRCVFVKMLKDVGPVAVDADGQQLVDMRAGDLFIIQYARVQRLVAAEDAVLV